MKYKKAEQAPLNKQIKSEISHKFHTTMMEIYGNLSNKWKTTIKNIT